jgi:hypothetical protein
MMMLAVSCVLSSHMAMKIGAAIGMEGQGTIKLIPSYRKLA